MGTIIAVVVSVVLNLLLFSLWKKSGFTRTAAKYMKIETFVIYVYFGLVLLDVWKGELIKGAFGDLGTTALLMWVLGIAALLDQVAISAMLGLFYAHGGKVWTRGGREQFTIVGGYSVRTYIPLLIETLIILTYPYLRGLHITIFNSGITIAIICSLLTYIICKMLARIIFRRVSIYQDI